MAASPKLPKHKGFSVNPPRSEPGGGHGLRWYAARGAVGLFVVALASLLAVLYRQEQEERGQSVERDLLWIEQNIQFAVTRDHDQLGQLGAGWDGSDPRALEREAVSLIQNSAGLVRVTILDAGGRVRASVPALSSRTAWPTAESVAARDEAVSTGLAAYGATYGRGEDRRFDLYVPWYREGRLAGTVVGVYGLRVMLAGLVPWWLAEKHLVTIRDERGAVLAAKSAVTARGPILAREVPLSPPGHGLVLHVEAFAVERQLLRNVLVAALVLLAGAVLWNLWSLRRHVARRLATEEALRAEHAFRKAMEDSLHTGMRAVDLEGRIVYANAAFCRMVGYTEEELLGSAPPQPYWPPEDHGEIEGKLRRAREAGMPATGIEMKLVRRGGEPFDALLYEAPLIDEAGRQAGWMGSVLDITERKRARELVHQQEEKLAATARLVTMGEMASTIAHELNQPLAAIASYTAGSLNLLGTGTLPREELGEALRKTAAQAQRAGRIIRRVHDFVRKRAPERGPVRINAVLEEAVGFAEAEARKRGVRVQVRPAPGDPELVADPVLLQQVILNLLRNAMDAMAATPPEERELGVAASEADGQVTVAIADRGTGIDPAVREKLFEPFFTTKPEGMGMGLNICRSILELHGGRVWAEANPGGGTILSFSIPLHGGGSREGGEAIA
jgi:two-component system sensor histidine kinase DctS